MLGVQSKCNFNPSAIENQPAKSRNDFSSTQDYFEYLASKVEELKSTLALNDKVLDEYDESGNTLLHVIAEGKPRDFTIAVAPYLTDARVAAQNHKGNTVLHTHVKYIGDRHCCEQTMPIYLKHSNRGATLSVQNHN